MKLRLPLSAQILAWFFLNLVLLGAAFFVFARVQFRFGPDWLLSGRAGDRVQAVSDVLAAELGERPRGEWNEILQRFSEAYRVRFALFRNDGALLAGEGGPLPPAVRERMLERAGPPPPRDRQPPRGPEPPRDRQPLRGPEPRREPTPPAEPPRFQDAAPPREPGRPQDFARDPEAPRGNAPFPPNQRLPRGKFVVRTENPVRYWVGTRLPALDRDPLRPGPATLLISSDSLRAGGLFLDLTPWVIVGFAAVLFSVLFWIPLIRGITRSVAQMTRATEQIAEGRFDARVSTGRRDELGSLAGAINRMAARLAGFVTGQKRFLGDIAHELCAPLARLQLALGILEQRADGKQRPCVDDVREEVQHMSSLVNELLSFSKASLRQRPIELQPVALAALARRIVEREAKTGEVIEIHIDDALHALAEPELLARALSNLLRNALRHATDAGPITLSARRDGGRVLLAVSDAGPGVPDETRERIFDPFFRLEDSRSRDTGGVGLGLAIVKTCVEACDGSVSARNREPHGLEVQIVLRASELSGVA